MLRFLSMSFFAVSLSISAGDFAFAQSSTGEGTAPLKYLPVQDGGRVKPFATFARESLQMIYGAKSFRAKDGVKRPAVEIVMTWLLVPQYWDEQPIVEISHRGLKESLKLPLDEKYFSPTNLTGNSRLALVLQELASFRETKQKLNPYFQAAQRLETQLGLYQMIKQGVAIRIAPPPVTSSVEHSGELQSADRWRAISELTGELQNKFATMARAFIQALPKSVSESPSVPAPGLPSLAASVDDFIAAARAENPDHYADEKMIKTEVHYQDFHPFLWAWVIYLVAAIAALISWQTARKTPYRAAWLFAAIAFLFHTYGFAVRCYITGRPPVSNMYESVVWVSWGAVMFSLFFEYFNRRRYALFSGAAVAVLCLVVADLSPTVLDSSVQPLEPVLRSNMWLTVHVLTITLSYSAFFLAWGLGNIGLGFIVRGETVSGERVRSLAQSTYRAMQVGIVLLAAGTILGGVWADYSWGRFWGWDPKETWAFIALMGYLALLHGRLVGWVQNFGMIAGAVIAFNLVIMAWYGVNFVLGAGLHSYGFGAGGVQYVGAFVLADLLFVAYTFIIKNSRAKAQASRV